MSPVPEGSRAAATACLAVLRAQSTCSSRQTSPPKSLTGNAATLPTAYTEASLVCMRPFSLMPPFSMASWPSKSAVLARAPMPTTTMSAGRRLPSRRIAAVTFPDETSKDETTVPLMKLTPFEG
uniref:Uncharacterized protein n=1 Tax=Arundo donax TaxID=35708 RepID=A0A0A9F5D9_ARUDO